DAEGALGVVGGGEVTAVAVVAEGGLFESLASDGELALDPGEFDAPEVLVARPLVVLLGGLRRAEAEAAGGVDGGVFLGGDVEMDLQELRRSEGGFGRRGGGVGRQRGASDEACQEQRPAGEDAAEHDVRSSRLNGPLSSQMRSGRWMQREDVVKTVPFARG